MLKMSGTQKKQKTNRNKSLYKQLFLFGRTYPLLRINLTLGVHSYAFGQALTAAAAPFKVRLIRSEHFSYPPKKEGKNVRNAKKQKTNRDKSLYKQVFLFVRAYSLLRINLTLGVHSYAFGQALTAAAAPFKVRLIRSEHFSYPPKKEGKNVRNAKKQKTNRDKSLYKQVFLFGRAYSFSWAERFIRPFLGTHLCILFFIFISFCIFVHLV